MGLGPSSAIYCLCNLRKGFPGGSDGKKICPQCGRLGFDPWVGKTPWIRERLPTPVFWPGEFHGLCSPWACEQSSIPAKSIPMKFLFQKFWGGSVLKLPFGFLKNDVSVSDEMSSFPLI